MTSYGYFIGATGTRYAYADIADRIRKEAPLTLGKHIFEQLAAIGLLEEMRNGTTPIGLPYTFADAAEPAVAEHTPRPWAYEEETGRIYFADGDVEPTIAVVDLENTSPRQGKADGNLITAAVNACEGIPTEALEAGVLREMREAIERLAFDARGDQSNPLIRDKTLESADRALAVIAKATAA